MGRLRVGLLGAGAMGAEHAAALREMADVEIAGVFSRTPARAGALAAACGAAAVGDLRRLIEDERVDAVDVCLPSASHHDAVLAALAHGKHVFCETPLALSPGEALAMRGAARRAGRLLQVGLLMRHVAPYQHLQELAASGEHGRLLSLTAYRLGSYLRPGAPDHKPHYGEPSTELMTFDFDFANWLMGPPTRLAASSAGVAGAPHGDISAILTYDEGRQATIIASGLMPTGQPFRAGFRALFDEAVVELDNVFGDGPPDSTFTVTGARGGPRDVGLAGHDPYAAELRRFVDCVAGRVEPDLLDVERALEALALSLATQQSLATGEAVAPARL